MKAYNWINIKSTINDEVDLPKMIFLENRLAIGESVKGIFRQFFVPLGLNNLVDSSSIFGSVDSKVKEVVFKEGAKLSDSTAIFELADSKVKNVVFTAGYPKLKFKVPRKYVQEGAKLLITRISEDVFQIDGES